MITYYRDRNMLVTSSAVRIGDRAFALADLMRVWHHRGRRSWGSVAGRGVIGVALVVPVLAGLLGIGIGLTMRASAATMIAFVGGGILLGLASLPLADLLLERMDRSYARGSRSLEIWADVRGTPVLLVRTDDAQRFGQIYRALQRALERTRTR